MSLKTLSIFLIAVSLMHVLRGEDPLKPTPALRAKCLSILSEGMGASDFWPSIHAAEGLTLAGHAQKVRQALEPKLAVETDDQRRCGIARELVRAGDRQRSAVLLEILQSEDPHGHVHAAESMYKVGWVGESSPLKDALSEDRDIRLRIMAAAALASHGSEKIKAESLSLLRRHLRDEDDPALFRLSAWVLGRIGDQQDREAILSKMQDAAGDPLVLAFLEHALAALGDDQGKDALLRNLDSKDPAIRTYAAVFAGETDMSEAAPTLIRQLDDENLDARIRAAHALILLSK